VKEDRTQTYRRADSTSSPSADGAAAFAKTINPETNVFNFGLFFLYHFVPIIREKKV